MDHPRVLLVHAPTESGQDHGRFARERSRMAFIGDCAEGRFAFCDCRMQKLGASRASRTGELCQASTRESRSASDEAERLLIAADWHALERIRNSPPLVASGSRTTDSLQQRGTSIAGGLVTSAGPH